jgi:serine/threonine protein kinase/WD40 repeat protein
MNNSTSGPGVPVSSAVMKAAEATVVKPVASVSTSASGAAAQPAPAGSPSPEAPYLGKTVIVDAAAAATPLMVGKYQIVDELGRGGMGLVYKAFDSGIGRTVALKVMSEELARDTAFRERFLREARGAGILQHPNIVTVHELGEWQGAPFIAMEFLQGRSLEEILTNEKGTTTVEERLKIVAQVCRGLDYAHARGIVHRDIKPANVMVTTDGVAKVVDFGIARLADQKLTNTGHVLGTVSYMSPEQLQGKALDGRSDIFAVGVMLFEALTWVLPFAAEDTGAAITNTLYRQPPSLSNFLVNCPRELDAVLKKCLAKDPAERFQTAGEVADRLDQVQQEMQRSQVAPTVVRSTPLTSDPGKAPAPSVSDATEQLSQAALQSLDAAKEWWKVASPGKRRNAITIAIPALLYVQSLIAPSGGFSDTGMGGGFVTSSTIVLPVAILSAIVIAIQLWGQRWKDSPQNVKLFTCASGFIAAAFCANKIALGLMWYVIFSKIFLVLVIALLGFFAITNLKFARELWRHGSAKERALSALGLLLLTGYFLVVFSLNLVDYAKNWRSSGVSFKQKEHAAESSAGKAAPTYKPGPKFELVRTLTMSSNANQENNHEAGRRVTAVVFSPDGSLIASGEWGGPIKIWDVATGQLLRTIANPNAPNMTFLAFSPDGRWLVGPMADVEADEIHATGGLVKIGLWDAATGALVRTLSGGGGCLVCAAFDSAGKRIATSNGGNIINIWDPATGNLANSFDAQAGVISMAFGPNGEFATGNNDGHARLWDVATGKLLYAMKGHYSWVSSVAFIPGPASTVLVSMGHDEHEMRLWSLNGELQRIVSAGGNLAHTTGGPNTWLAATTPSGDGQVRFWDHNGDETPPLQAHVKAVNAVAFSADGNWFATASDDATVRIWKVAGLH